MANFNDFAKMFRPFTVDSWRLSIYERKVLIRALNLRLQVGSDRPESPGTGYNSSDWGSITFFCQLLSAATKVKSFF